MRIQITIFSIIILISIIINVSTIYGQTYVSGTIASNTTWAMSGSPYIVTGSVLVNSGVTLTIEGGVDVKFNTSIALQIDGELKAQGTVGDSITFTSNQATPSYGDWGFIYFTDTCVDATFDGSGNYTGGSILQYCAIKYGGGSAADGVIQISSSSPFIDHCKITNNKGSGISATSSSNLKVSNNTVSDNTGEGGDSGSGLILNGGSATITNNTFSDNIAHDRAGGITIIGGSAATLISDNTITGNSGDGNPGGGGVWVKQNTSTVTISNNTISNNSTTTAGIGGIKVTSNTSDVIIEDNIISNNSAHPWVSDGIDIGHGPTIKGHATIRNNTITGNTRLGLSVNCDNQASTITGNVVSNHTNYGIAVGNGSNNTVQNNTIESSGECGLVVYSGSSLTISGNTIQNNTNNGVSMSGGSGSFQNNTVTNNGGTRAVSFSNADWTINYNNIHTNTSTYNLYYDGASGTTLDATNNWWGTIDVIDIANKIYDSNDNLTKGTVDYSPLLMSEGGVSNEIPSASADVDPPYGSAPLTVSFTGSGSDSDGSVALYDWDFDGDGTYDWNSTVNGNTSYTYTTSGNYVATFRVTDNLGLANKVLSNVGVVAPGEPIQVGGTLSNNRTWTQGNIFEVTDNIVIPSGITLTIEQDVEIRFHSDKGMQVDGTLIARGTSSDSVIFKANSGTSTGSWGFIYFTDTSVDATYDGSVNYTGGSILQYCGIRYGGGSGADGVIQISSSSPFIDHSKINNNKGSGISATNSSNLKVKNNTVSDNTGEGGDSGSGLILNGGNATITNNTFSDNIGHDRAGGITIIGGSAATLISDNTITGNSGDGNPGGGGVWAKQTTSTVTISNNTISNNSASTPGVGGVKVTSNTADVIIEDNIISNNSNHLWVCGGVEIGHGGSGIKGHATIRNNTITGNTYTGIGVAGDNQVTTITGNVVSNNIRDGLGIGGSNITVENNIIASNSECGLVVGSGSNHTISGNTIQNNSNNGFYIAGGSGSFQNNTVTGNAGTRAISVINANWTINYNNIHTNTSTYNLYYDGAFGTTLNATNNWWGTTDSGVIATEIYDYYDDSNLGEVNFQPLLFGPNLTAPGQPDIVASVVLKEDDTYSADLTTNVYVGATLYIELNGTDGNMLNRDYTSVTVSSSVTDPGSITVPLYETDTNTGIYRGTATLGTESNNTTNTIGAGVGETITITSDVDDTKSDQVNVIAESIPPSDITDLSVSSFTATSAILTCTAPGDDSTSGTATTYDIRYSTSTITTENWDSATQTTGEPSPSVAGSSETFTIAGISENTTYYFAIKTADEVPNWSGLSNVVSGGTTQYLIKSNNTWKCTTTEGSGWYELNFDDSSWDLTEAPYHNANGGNPQSWLPGTTAQWMWHSNGAVTCFFRKAFGIANLPTGSTATLKISVDDDYDVYLNETKVAGNWNGTTQFPGETYSIGSQLREGRNVIAIKGNDTWGGAESVLLELHLSPDIVPCYWDQEAAVQDSEISFNEGGGDGGDGRGVDMTFSSLTGSGNIRVEQVNGAPDDSPCFDVCGHYLTIEIDESITSFSTDITFHYTDADATGYTESNAFFGIAKFNSSTNTWQWLGGTVDSANNTVTVSGVTSFSTFALFRRIFGDITGDGYVDAADLQRLGDCWHSTNSGEFTAGSDARFFNFNKNTDGGNQIIDAADLQVFGDCWHNGVAP